MEICDILGSSLSLFPGGNNFFDVISDIEKSLCEVLKYPDFETTDGVFNIIKDISDNLPTLLSLFGVVTFFILINFIKHSYSSGKIVSDESVDKKPGSEFNILYDKLIDKLTKTVANLESDCDKNYVASEILRKVKVFKNNIGVIKNFDESKEINDVIDKIIKTLFDKLGVDYDNFKIECNCDVDKNLDGLVSGIFKIIFTDFVMKSNFKVF